MARKHQSMEGAGIFLISVALMAAMVGCGEPAPPLEPQYIPVIAAGWDYTVGVKSDGTVIAVGQNDYGQCDVDDWTDITQVATSDYHTVGLKSDGTVIVVGENDYGQCDVGDWTEIMQIAAGGYHTVGLKDDHTVVAVDWGAQLAEWDLIYRVP